MNKFEIYKLKKAGLTNLAINKILKEKRKLNLREIASISGNKHPHLFIKKYRNLDIKLEKEIFKKYNTISILDDEYPIQLKNIYNPPVLLFYKGNIKLLNEPILSFVGSRKSSPISNKTISKIIGELSNKFVIASGLARGIDTSSHLASLKNGGKTIAVIGTGINKYYPKENKKLQDFIGKNHLLISEYLPDENPLKFHFPQRNRILAGLALGVVVIEARMKSGSLITAERAMEEGREVYCVPGNIIDGNFSGCNHLIQEGAKLVNTGLDILSDYDL